MLPMIDNSIAAASCSGATVVLPGTLYNYGPDAFPLLREGSPQNPSTRKGAIRVELERRLQADAAAGNCRAIVVRAGDFFGSRPGNSWFSQGLVKPGQPVRAVYLPSEPGIGHLWSYLPDVAQTMVELIGRRQALPAFAGYHMRGHWDCDGGQMGQAIQRAVIRHGGKEPRLKTFPWWQVTLASPFMPTLQELLEMRYLWRNPVNMENQRLLEVPGREPHTPLDGAVETALFGMGCLGHTAAVPQAFVQSASVKAVTGGVLR